MNEQIKELAKQAMSIVLNGNDPDGDIDKMYVPSEFTKKFTELIVRECVLEAMDAIHHKTSIRTQLYKHFGVE